MRLIEFASAEEQIELWKLVSASVWSSLQQQQEQQRQAQATAAAGRAKREAPSPKRSRKRALGKGKLKLPRVPIHSPKPVLNPTIKATQPSRQMGQAISSQNKPTPNVQQQPAQQSQQLPKPTVKKPYASIPSAGLRVGDTAVDAGAVVGAADNRTHQPNVVPARGPVNTVRQRGETGQEPVKRR
jgi:hypothetical protein